MLELEQHGAMTTAGITLPEPTVADHVAGAYFARIALHGAPDAETGAALLRRVLVDVADFLERPLTAAEVLESCTAVAEGSVR